MAAPPTGQRPAPSPAPPPWASLKQLGAPPAGTKRCWPGPLAVVAWEVPEAEEYTAKAGHCGVRRKLRVCDDSGPFVELTLWGALAAGRSAPALSPGDILVAWQSLCLSSYAGRPQLSLSERDTAWWLLRTGSEAEARRLVTDAGLEFPAHGLSARLSALRPAACALRALRQCTPAAPLGGAWAAWVPDAGPAAIAPESTPRPLPDWGGGGDHSTWGALTAVVSQVEFACGGGLPGSTLVFRPLVPNRAHHRQGLWAALCVTCAACGRETLPAAGAPCDAPVAWMGCGCGRGRGGLTRAWRGLRLTLLPAGGGVAVLGDAGPALTASLLAVSAADVAESLTRGQGQPPLPPTQPPPPAPAPPSVPLPALIPPSLPPSPPLSPVSRLWCDLRYLRGEGLRDADSGGGTLSEIDEPSVDDGDGGNGGDNCNGHGENGHGNGNGAPVGGGGSAAAAGTMPAPAAVTDSAVVGTVDSDSGDGDAVDWASLALLMAAALARGTANTPFVFYTDGDGLGGLAAFGGGVMRLHGFDCPLPEPRA